MVSRLPSSASGDSGSRGLWGGLRGAGAVDGGLGADEAEADVVDGVAGGVEADEPCPAFAQHADGESGVADVEAGAAGLAREPDRSHPLAARAREVESPAVGDEDDAVPARAGVVGAYGQPGEVRVDEPDAGFAAAVDLDGGGSVVGRCVGRCLSDLSTDVPVGGASRGRRQGEEQGREQWSPGTESFTT